jgi:hypothetical protein
MGKVREVSIFRLKLSGAHRPARGGRTIPDVREKRERYHLPSSRPEWEHVSVGLLRQTKQRDAESHAGRS